jgi:hypothetical protein
MAYRYGGRVRPFTSARQRSSFVSPPLTSTFKTGNGEDLHLEQFRFALRAARRDRQKGRVAEHDIRGDFALFGQAPV